MAATGLCGIPRLHAAQAVFLTSYAAFSSSAYKRTVLDSVGAPELHSDFPKNEGRPPHRILAKTGPPTQFTQLPFCTMDGEPLHSDQAKRGVVEGSGDVAEQRDCETSHCICQQTDNQLCEPGFVPGACNHVLVEEPYECKYGCCQQHTPGLVPLYAVSEWSCK